MGPGITALVARVRDKSGRFASVERAAENPVDTTFFTFTGALSGASDELKKPYQQHPWVYACVRVLSRELAGVPFRFYSGSGASVRSAPGRRLELMRRQQRAPKPPPPKPGAKPGAPKPATTPTPADDDSNLIESGEIYELFKRPNPYMSRAQLWEMTVINLSVSGSCAWIKGGPLDLVKTANEIPKELIPINGRLLTPRINPQTLLPESWFGTFQGGGAAAGVPVNFLPHQLIWFRYGNPYTPFDGLAPLDAAMLSARTDFAAMGFNAMFFENGADPGSVIETEGVLSPEQARVVRETFDDRHRGWKRSHRTAVLGGKAKWIPNPRSQKDMEFGLLRETAFKEICGVFGVPHTMVGITDNANRASSQVTKAILFEDTLVPVMGYLEDVLEIEIGNWQADQWGEFDLDSVEALRENTTEKVAAATALFAMGVPIGQIGKKLELGLDPMEHDDVGFLPGTLVPVSDAILGPPDPIPALMPDGTPVPDGPPGSGPAPKPSGTTPPPPPPPPAATGAKKGFAQEERSAAHWRAHVREVQTPSEGFALRKIKGYLSRARNELLGLLRQVLESKTGPKKAFDPKALVNLSEADIARITLAVEKWDAELRKVMGSVYYFAAAQAIKRLKLELGGFAHFNAQNPEVLYALAQKQIKVVGINNTIRARLRSTLLKSLADLRTPTQTAEDIFRALGDDLRGVMNSTASRALTIARTETAQAISIVRNAAFRAEGVVQHQWVTSNDEFVRPSHVACDGQIRVVGVAFPNGLLFPSDPLGSAAEVVNCRCVAVAVVEPKS